MTKPISTQPLGSRVERLLAQVLVHFLGDASLQKKALALRASGFSNAEIGGLLGKTPEVIAQTLYMARKESTGSRSRSSKSKKKRIARKPRPMKKKMIGR